MDITKVLSILFGTIGIFGGITIFFNAARKDSIIAVLTKENTSLKDYNVTLENSATRLTAERDGYKRQYEDARDLAQGSPQLKVMARALQEQAAATAKQTRVIAEYLKENTK
jgi:hypothetical protein